MSDIGHGNPRLFVQGRLHRKKRQDVIHRPGNFLDSTTPPRPNRRADIMYRFDARRLQISFQTQIEVWSINADKYIRADIEQTLFKLATYTGNLTVMFQCFDITHNRQFFHRPPGIKTDRLHFWAANAVKNRIGKLFLECRHQMAGQEIPRGLSCHHGNTNRSVHQRIMPRFESSRKSTKS